MTFYLIIMIIIYMIVTACYINYNNNMAIKTMYATKFNSMMLLYLEGG